MSNANEQLADLRAILDTRQEQVRMPAILEEIADLLHSAFDHIDNLQQQLNALRPHDDPVPPPHGQDEPLIDLQEVAKSAAGFKG